jgi:hypothetical protein
LRVVIAEAAPTASWLRGAGLDAAFDVSSRAIALADDARGEVRAQLSSLLEA